MLTFIYKTGFKNSIDGSNFKPPRKNSKAAKASSGLCSHTTDDTTATYSHYSHDTRGVCRAAMPEMRKECCYGFVFEHNFESDKQRN